MGKRIPFWPEWTEEEVIGQGSYGVVYKIRKHGAGSGDTDIYSALKVLHIPTTDSEIHNLRQQGMDEASVRELIKSDVKAIENEIRVMISLASATGIVTIEDYHIEELQDQIGWNVYIRMELLESLPAFIERQGTLSKEEALEMGSNLCDALKACENQDIIHRDIKPANIFRNKFGQFKLGDFGVAKQMEGTHSAATRIGTPSYEAPEIFFGQKYDHTVDIYGLGMVLYTCLNQGRKPFYPPYPEKLTRENMQEALQKRLNGEPVPPVPGMDQEIYEIIEKACAFQPSRRYQSAVELKSDLERYRSGRSEATVKENQNSPDHGIHYGEEQTILLHMEKKKSRTPFIIAGIFAVCTLALGILIGGRLSGKNGHEREEKIAELTGMLTSKPMETTKPTITVMPEPTNTSTPSSISASEPTVIPMLGSTDGSVPAAVSEQTPSGINVVVQQATYRVIEGFGVVNLRQDASAEGHLIGIVPSGFELTSTGVCENGWIRIDYQGQTAYVDGNLVTKVPVRETSIGEADQFSDVYVGDIITFGSYEQDNDTSNGKEEIEWIVLAKENNRALLVSEYALDCQEYNKEYLSLTWDTCTLRIWLNSTFISTAFTEEEQSRIPMVTVRNADNPEYGTEGGNDTEDKAFLLSIDEVNQYFGSAKQRKCVPTDYAIAQGVSTSHKYSTGGGITCWWWLRSPGRKSVRAACVYSDGSVDLIGGYVYSGEGAVRPALWINLEP